MELSTARIHGAKTTTLKTWRATFDNLLFFFWMYNLFLINVWCRSAWGIIIIAFFLLKFSPKNVKIGERQKVTF